MVVSLNREQGVEWSVISRSLPGETVSGDHHVVMTFPGGALLAVIDGLGHGEEATLAARRAADVLTGHPNSPVLVLIQECHRALRDTRGAAMTLISLEKSRHRATAIGIGNVEAMVVRADSAATPQRESLLLRNGVVGFQLPALQESVLEIRPGDLLVMATDGVRGDFGDVLAARDPLPAVVEGVLGRSYRGTDDALVLACRILPDDES